MNAEVIKAMNKKGNKKHFIESHKWWKNNSYKVYRIILFPVWMLALASERIEHWTISRNEWNEARANEIFNYYIPRRAEWNAEEKHFYFFDNGYGWNFGFAKKHLKWKDRTFWKIHNGFCGGQLRRFLIDDFELEGFRKEVGDTLDGWTEITFTLIEDN